MPTYEYECKSCSHTFEVFQNMTDEALKICPECGKELRRLINGGGGIIFKGSGFYSTDKKAGGKSDSKADSKADNKSTPAPCPGCAAAAQSGSCPAAASANTA